MTQFNRNRFLRLLKNDFLLNKKKILIILGVITGLVFAIYTLVGFGVVGADSIAGLNTDITKAPESLKKFLAFFTHENVVAVLTAASYASYVWGIASFVIMTRVFANLQDRKQEIDFLTLPATNLEKWSSRVAYVSLISLAGLVAHSLGYAISLLVIYPFNSGFVNESLALYVPTDGLYQLCWFRYDIDLGRNPFPSQCMVVYSIMGLRHILCLIRVWSLGYGNLHSNFRCIRSCQRFRNHIY